MRNDMKWIVVAVVCIAALWSAWQYASWQRDRREAALIARAVKYAVEQFSPAYQEFVQKNRRTPRDNMDVGLPPPRDSLWVGLSLAELYPNGEVHFEFPSTDPDRRPVLVWRIQARTYSPIAARVCGARNIPLKVLEWNGLICDASVDPPSKDAPAPSVAAAVPVPAPTPADEVLAAVRKDDPVQLETMRKAGRDICAADSTGVVPLAEAARGSQSQALTVLLDACDVNAIEPFSGRTALMIASAAHDVDIVRTLLKAGANPVLQSGKSDSAWFLLGTASDDSSKQIRNMLQVKGAAIDALAPDQSTLLMRAASAGNVELVDWLLQNGAKIDLQDKAGRSALMYATLSPDGEQTLQMLISNNARINLVDHDGRTAPALAQTIDDQSRRERVEEMLRSAGGKS